jgi:fructokinase
MKSVICFGEALIDFLQTDLMEQGQLSLPGFRQYPGGAPANAAVAVAKLGGKALFAGQVGQDPFGDFLRNALQLYGVDTRYLVQHPSAKTALAFVMLDEHGERSFTFHRHESADVLFSAEQVDAKWFEDQPLLHFCSNTLTTADIAKCTAYIVQQARNKQAIVSFDVNLRHNLWPDNLIDKALVNGLVQQADIVKFSQDELAFLAGADPEKYLQDCLAANCKLLVITDGAKPIRFLTRTQQGEITPPVVKAVDTTAGGDAFIGGLLFGLSQQADIPQTLADIPQLKSLLRFAAACGAHTVTQAGAFTALPDQRLASQLLSQSLAS